MENFPYSNFHDLNLDWMISEHKKLSNQQTNLANRVASLSSNVETLMRNIEELTEQVNNIESPTYEEFSGTIAAALDAAVITYKHANLSTNSRITVTKYGRVVFLYCLLSSTSSTIANGTHIMTLAEKWIPRAAYASSPSFTTTASSLNPWLYINGHMSGTGSGYVTLRGSTINTTQRMFYATYISYEED